VAEKVKTPFGGQKISVEAIEQVASETALTCYGVISLSHKNREGKALEYFLNSKSFGKGAIATKTSAGWVVDLYIIVVYGLKLTEIIGSVQSSVKYELEKTFDVKFKAVNVYIQGVKVV
jgi:uncharacterized alkaline shock family protein YloU